MKPGDHPDFFRAAAPAGASRESTIRLDVNGRFWHDGEPVEHAALEAALHGWINRHPDDGRFILTNGYDWTYFAVDDAPYTVRALGALGALGSAEGGMVVLLQLSDGTEEVLDPTTLRVGVGDALYARVKLGGYDARFSRHAQLALAPWLEEGETGVRLRVGERCYAIGQLAAPQASGPDSGRPG
jgi:hypothetical protein